MKRVISKMANVGLWVSGLSTIALTSYAMYPEVYNYGLDFLGIEQSMLGGIAGLTGLTTFLGVTSRLLKNSVNTDMVLMKAHYDQLRTKDKNEFKNELDRVYAQFQAQTNLTNKQQALILSAQKVQFNRYLKLDDSLISKEDKEEIANLLNQINRSV